MGLQLVKGVRFNVATGQSETYEEMVDMPNPRISEIQRRMQEIDGLLKQGDYRTIKRMEDDLTDDVKWGEHVQARKALRAEYNTIEAELKTLV